MIKNLRDFDSIEFIPPPLTLDNLKADYDTNNYIFDKNTIEGLLTNINGPSNLVTGKTASILYESHDLNKLNIFEKYSPKFAENKEEILTKAVDTLLGLPNSELSIPQGLSSPSVMSEKIQNVPLKGMLLLNQYCWWVDCSNSPEKAEKREQVQEKQSPVSTTIRLTLDSENETETNSNRSPCQKGIKKKSLPHIDEKIRRVLSKLQDGSIASFKACKKKIKGFFSNRSGRRSKYIGVSKNNYNWQVLINVGNKKKYIGTFPTQKEAAIAYDFYSIALHSEKAKTNFSYEGKIVEDMIKSYLSSSDTCHQNEVKRIFEPAQFVERV